MTQYLPPNLLALFAARDPIPYLPPSAKLPHEKKSQPYAGVSSYLHEFEDPKDTPAPTRCETKDERKERKRRERAEQIAYKLEQDLALWDPTNDPNIQMDPFKTLFVARINYDTSESKLRREFESYGPVKRIRVCHDSVSGKPRGYAFVEFEHERDMHSSYKHADGKKIDGRRVLVDIERGRTIKNWRPRRLGGGLGGTRKGGPDVNVKYSGREDPAWHTGDRDRTSRDRSRERSERRERGGAVERDRGDRAERPERRRERPERPERRRRSRSREPRRRRSRSKERKRSKSKESEDQPKERKRRRSRSREKKRSRSRDRSDRKRSRRSRSRERRGRSKDRRDRDGVMGEDEIKRENGRETEYETGMESSAQMDEYGNYPPDIKVKMEPVEDPSKFSLALQLAANSGNGTLGTTNEYGTVEEGEEQD